MAPRVTLVSFSGGVDSTYALKYLLCETDDVVLAHHVKLVNIEDRHHAETPAARRIAEYCRKNYRAFTYTESTVDRSNLKVAGLDLVTCACEMGVVANDYFAKNGKRVDAWVTGECLEEAGSTDLYGPIEKAMEANSWPNEPPKLSQLEVKPKVEFVGYLGTELASLCWYCRTPVLTDVGWKSCRNCKACKLKNELGWNP